MRYSKPMFDLGKIVTTNSTSVLRPDEIASLLRRHCTGDFGIMDNEDILENQKAIRNGEFVMSVYSTAHGHIWVRTEGSREYTTVSFPDEY
jgi:hypothetical protein